MGVRDRINRWVFLALNEILSRISPFGYLSDRKTEQKDPQRENQNR